MELSEKFRGSLEATSHRIAVWSDEFRRLPPLLDPDSSVAADNSIYVVFAPSHVVYHSLATAISHLDLFIRWITMTGEWHVGLYTVLRTALVGSCQGLYVAGTPERAVRQTRALLVMVAAIKDERSLLNEGTLLIDQATKTTRLAELAQYLVTAEAAAKTLGISSLKTPNTTDVIAAAVKMMPEQNVSRDIFAAAVASLWRGGSAHAHASPLGRFMTLKVGDRTTRPDGTEFAFAEVDPDHMYIAVDATTRIFAEALRCYREAHQRSGQQAQRLRL